MPHATMTGPRSLSDLEGYTPDFRQGFIEALDQCEGTDCESGTSNSECTEMCGIGATICAAETTTCEECLGSDASKQYSWSAVDSTCYGSCMFAPANASCYKEGRNLRCFCLQGYQYHACHECSGLKPLF